MYLKVQYLPFQNYSFIIILLKIIDYDFNYKNYIENIKNEGDIISQIF